MRAPLPMAARRKRVHTHRRERCRTMRRYDRVRTFVALDPGGRSEPRYPAPQERGSVSPSMRIQGSHERHAKNPSSGRARGVVVANSNADARDYSPAYPNGADNGRDGTMQNAPRFGAFCIAGVPDDDLLSHGQSVLSSACRRFTVLFGMGRGGAGGLWSSGFDRSQKPEDRRQFN